MRRFRGRLSGVLAFLADVHASGDGPAAVGQVELAVRDVEVRALDEIRIEVPDGNLVVLEDPEDVPIVLLLGPRCVGQDADIQAFERPFSQQLGDIDAGGVVVPDEGLDPDGLLRRPDQVADGFEASRAIDVEPQIVVPGGSGRDHGIQQIGRASCRERV